MIAAVRRLGVVLFSCVLGVLLGGASASPGPAVTSSRTATSPGSVATSPSPLVTFPRPASTPPGAAATLPGPRATSSGVVATFPDPAVTYTGWFHVIWGDGPPGSGVESVAFVLIDDAGAWTRLRLAPRVAAQVGTGRAFDRRRVLVTGVMSVALAAGSAPAGATLHVESVALAGGPAPAAEPAAVAGAYPWVTILCRFADSPTVTPHPKNHYEQLMGSAYPGLDHYWREASYGNVNLDGSAVAGWYTLPHPRSTYVYDRNGNGVIDGPDDVDLQKLTADCTGVADADVYFPAFLGINVVLNQDLDCCSYGGSTRLDWDDQSRSYSATWLAAGIWDHKMAAHEMGHGFGLPHSSGPYDQTYDSWWDVMSGGLHCPTSLYLLYGCLGIHTIAYHRDLLGWFPPALKFVAPPGSEQTIAIQSLTARTSPTDYLMAQIPIGAPGGAFYTVEARTFAGYDAGIPGEAIVIHKVNPADGSRPARVMDADGDGDPNDDGAMWLPGETFVDADHQIFVSVLARTSTGFIVRVSTGIAPLTLSLGLNAGDYGPGETLRASLTFANPGLARTVDLYLGAFLPPSAGPLAGCPLGDAFVLLPEGSDQPVARCLSGDPASFPPRARSVNFPAGTSATTMPDVLSFVWPSDAPRGPYRLFIVATPPGAFTDGRLDMSDLLAMGSVGFTFFGGPLITVFQDNMEGGGGEWSAQAPWALTATGGHSGAHAWAWVNSSGKASGSPLTSRVIDLSALATTVLTFWHWYEIAGGYFATVFVGTHPSSGYWGVAWFRGSSGGWQQATVDLSRWAGEPEVTILFQVFSSDTQTGDGWWIDDVVVSGRLRVE